MIEIRTLQDLSAEDVRRLSQGYVSSARYAVRKEETPERTTITLERQALDEPYAKRWYSDQAEVARYQRIVRDDNLSLGVFDGEHLVGIAIAERIDWNRTLWVWEVHVDETHRRRGIGRRLIDALAERARSAGLRVMVCETQSSNVPAIDFYRRVGFELDAIDLSYYTNRDVEEGEVALFMKRKLAP